MIVNLVGGVEGGDRMLREAQSEPIGAPTPSSYESDHVTHVRRIIRERPIDASPLH